MPTVHAYVYTHGPISVTGNYPWFAIHFLGVPYKKNWKWQCLIAKDMKQSTMEAYAMSESIIHGIKILMGLRKQKQESSNEKVLVLHCHSQDLYEFVRDALLYWQEEKDNNDWVCTPSIFEGFYKYEEERQICDDLCEIVRDMKKYYSHRNFRHKKFPRIEISYDFPYKVLDMSVDALMRTINEQRAFKLVKSLILEERTKSKKSNSL